MLRNYGVAGGFAQGLSEGLRNVATIRNIQKSVEDEERALRQEDRQKVADTRAATTFDQQQAEYKRLHDRTIDPETVIGGLGLDEEGQNYVRKVSSPFIPQGGKLSITDLTTIRDNVMKDPKVVSEIQNHRRRALGKEISAMEEEVNALGSDQGGGLAQVGIYNQKKALLEQKKARMQELDPNWSKREELALKEKELKVHQTAAEKESLPTTPAGLRAYALKHNDPKYTKAAEETEAAEIRKEQTKGESYADREAARREAAEKKAAITAATNGVNKYYGDLEKSVKERIKELSEDPTEQASVAEYQKILTNIHNYRNHDLDAAGKGIPPPYIKKLQENWMAGRSAAGSQPEAKPTVKAPSRFTVKEVTPEAKTTPEVRPQSRSIVSQAEAATIPTDTTAEARPEGISPRDWAKMTAADRAAYKAKLRETRKAAYFGR